MGTTEELLVALQHGRKIEAIKNYRLLFGCDLKSAKDMVEAVINGVLANCKSSYTYDCAQYVVVDPESYRTFTDRYSAEQHALDCVSPSRPWVVAKVVAKATCEAKITEV